MTEEQWLLASTRYEAENPGKSFAELSLADANAYLVSITGHRYEEAETDALAESIEQRAAALAGVAEQERVPPRILLRQSYAAILSHVGLTATEVSDEVLRRTAEILRERKQEELKRRRRGAALEHGYLELYAELGCTPMHFLRWAGADAWTLQEAVAAAAAFGIRLSPTQIRQFMLEGRRGLPRANLTGEQAEKLYEKLDGLPLENELEVR